MSVDITRADVDNQEEWNRSLDRSPHSTPFHYYEALQVQSKRTGLDLHPLIGRKGQEIIGLFPVFELQRGPFAAAFSPPPYLDTGIQWLGPVLMPTGNMKVRKVERQHRAFIDGCFDWISKRFDPDLIRVTPNVRYNDVRPFKWNGCSATPNYTYIVDLTVDEETLLSSFSSDARKNIHYDGEYEYGITQGNAEAAEKIIERVRRRLADQNKEFRVPSAFGAELFDRLPEGNVRPYVCKVENKFAGGILVLEQGDTAYRWHGATEHSDVPVTDLLDWRIMKDAMDRGIARYDLVGAETPRLNHYKAKFAPKPATVFEIERTSWPIELLLSAYRYLR